MERQELQDKLGLLHRENFWSNYLKLALKFGFIDMTIPDKSNSKVKSIG